MNSTLLHCLFEFRTSLYPNIRKRFHFVENAFGRLRIFKMDAQDISIRKRYKTTYSGNRCF